jgi:uncharacterized protein DUF6152
MKIRRYKVKTLLKSAIAALTMVVVFAALGGVVAAHHGRAGYVESSTVTGTVTSVEWKNPHCFINFDVKDEKGNVVHWVGELSAPQTMLAAGVNRNTLKPGDEIVVQGMKGGVPNAPVTLVNWITRNGQRIIGDPNSKGSFTSDTR